MAERKITIKLKQIVDGKEKVSEAVVGLDSLAKAAERAQNALKKSAFSSIAENIGSISQSLSNFGSTLNDLSAGYESYDKAMRAVNTMAGKDSAGFADMTRQVTELSKALPIAREELASGLYQVISNGVPESNWLSFLEASAKSSVGGMADLSGVVTVTSTIIKNYGLAWEDALAVQDKIQMTAKNGVTSFEQLQQALPRVTGNAATLGVSIDELMAAFATLTGVSGNTAEVSTQLAAVFNALIKPSKEAAKMADEMGFAFDASSIKAAGGMQNFLDLLKKAVSEYAETSGMLESEVYARLFGSAEALRALGPLTDQLASKYDENVAAMAESTGSIESAFADMSQTAEAKGQLMRNAFASVTDALGQLASGAKPVVAPLIMIGQTATGIAALGKTFAALNSVTWIAAIRTKGLTTAMRTLKGAAMLALVPTNRQVAMLRTNLHLSTAAARGLGIAIKSALVSTGIGLVLVGLSALYETFANKAEEAAEKQRELNEATKEFTSSITSISEATGRYAAAEQGKLDVLYHKLTDETAAREERNKALRELQTLYPDYFRNLNLETASAQQLAAAYNSVRANIIKASTARAAQDKITENAGRKIDLEGQLPELQRAYDEASQRVLETRLAFDKKKKEVVAKNMDSLYYANEWDAWRKAVQDAQTASDALTAVQNQISEIDDANASLVDVMDRNAITMGAVPTPAPAIPASAKAAKAEDIIPDLSEVTSRQLNCLADYETALTDLEKVRKHATQDQIKAVDDAIAKVKEQRDAFLGISADAAPTLAEIRSRQLNCLDDIDDAIRDLTAIRGKASASEIADITKEISLLQQKRNELLGIADDAQVETALPEVNPFAKLSGIEKLGAGWQMSKNLHGAMEDLAKVADKNATAWERFAGVLDGLFAIYENVTQIIKLIDAMGEASMASATTQAAAANLTTQAATEDANAQLVDASAKAMNAHSWIPFVGVALGAASVAMMVATMLGLPKFAEGGIAFGPTLGLFGEYSGASHNPEVVAPLDRLRDMISPNGASLPQTIKLRAERGALTAALEYDQNFGYRTR